MADDFGNGDGMDLPVGKDAVNRLIQENSDIFSDTHCKVCSAVLISESQKLAHYQSKKHANKYRRYMSIHQGEDFTPAKKMKADDTEQTPSEEVDTNTKYKCCSVCNMTFSSPVVADSHYNGKIHSKNLKLKEQGGVPQVMPRVAKPIPVPPGTPDKSDPNKFCQLCNATFNNPHMAEQHYKGKKHEKQETKNKLMSIYSRSGKMIPQSTPLNPQTPGSGATGNWFRCDPCNVVLNSIEQYQAHISGSKHKNNSNSMVTTLSESLTPPPTRKSYGGALSSNFQPSSEAHSTVPAFSLPAGGLSSSGGYSSIPGNFSSYSRGLSSARRTASGEGLLPLPSYAPETSDGYNYFSQGY
ncbi:zinc finger protein 346 isoform X1 [Bufo gargarizans]|uniref:zinc finger protein 346 isoform X1 n=1 Tax=Bufo gargarizans TaxID=30331 RepID=UPI001CF457BF|nr:zinc finger protein 346 isoform X1 [Bufo gargarizans]